MSLRISGKFYEIEWSEDEQKWIGYVYTDDTRGRIRVWSDEEYEHCAAWVLHNLDEMIQELRIKYIIP